MSNRVLAAAACALAIDALCGVASAQAQDASGGGRGGGLEEITVTAQRREETLQIVPVAISAFTTLEMETRQIYQTKDIIHNVPNMIGHNNTGTANANTYYLRGLGSTESLGVIDPPVGTYVDEVYLARQNLNNFGFFDVERIEVLRGPQGTLFGRNTTGGAINVILRKPSNEVRGYAEAETGSYNEVGGRASIDIPVVDQKVLTKVSVYAKHDDGYATQLPTGKKINFNHSYGGRGAVRVLPSDTVTFDFAVDYTSSDHSNQLNVIDPVTGDRVSHSGLLQNAIVPYITGGKAYIEPLSSLATSTSVTANLKWDLGDTTLNSISGYRISRQSNFSDSQAEQPQGAFSTGGQPANSIAAFKQFSEELKLSGHWGDKLDYVAGLYFFRENDTADLGSPSTAAGTGRVTVLADRTLKNSSIAEAVYGQADYHLLSDVTLTAGVRFTNETKHVAADTNPGGLGTQMSTAGIAAAGIPLRLHTAIATPRFAAEYQYTPDVMLFASITRGFKSGGWNGRATSNTTLTSFLPEKIWSEEVGIRSDWFDKKLRVNVTGFYGYTENIQLSAAVLTSTNLAVFNTTNPADFRDYGLEIEATAVPIENLNISTGIGLQNARFTNVSAGVKAQQARCRLAPGSANADCNSSFIDVNGDIATPARAPKVTWNATVSYSFDVGPVVVTPRAQVSLQSEMSLSTSGSEKASHDPNPRVNQTWAGSQWLFNAGVRFEPTSLRNLSFTAECRNCFMKDYPASYLAPFQFLDEPGTWSVRASYKF